ncbi:vitelline membrane protein Vm32E [Drosophila ficusphila]|uniref:vitelline membrane protein Vm32E n=1 Tax=Drosophila ficusphila TaxID=30025 RepID=UPI0007E6C9D2|nr:vitelline membrane protein Vm32E [Drosophila ficusphila]
MKIVALIVAAFVAYASASCQSSGYSSPGIAAPPCPTNYLFSCQPQLAPAPCSQPQEAPAYGSSGAYTEPIPLYAGNPKRREAPRFRQSVGTAALMEELRALGVQGFHGQQ